MMYCVCDTDNYKHHYHEEYFCDKDNPWRRELIPELIYMYTSCKDCGRPKMPAVKPQVDLPPYNVVWPEEYPLYKNDQRVAFYYTRGVSANFTEKCKYADVWQPYFKRVNTKLTRATQHAIRGS